MLVVYPSRVECVAFGPPLRVSERPIAIIAFSQEVDRSRMSAEYFFEYLADMWQETMGCHPNNMVILESIIVEI